MDWLTIEDRAAHKSETGHYGESHKAHLTFIGSLVLRVYKFQSGASRRVLRKVVSRLEGGEIYSETLREIFRVYHGVDIGMYTHGSCFEPFQFDPMTTVGRYCSIAKGARVIRTNHRIEFRSTHGFFFNSGLGYCPEGLMTYQPLSIGNDVWLGANSLILPHVQRIGDGAVVAAGAVVAKDVPPYAVVVGNPGRVVRFRFNQDVITKLLASKWWERRIDELCLEEFCQPLQESTPSEPEI